MGKKSWYGTYWYDTTHHQLNRMHKNIIISDYSIKVATHPYLIYSMFRVQVPVARVRLVLLSGGEELS